MEIFKVTPQGFCKGVIRAMTILEHAIEDDNLPKPIYILGQLVHNKHIAEAYAKKGIIHISSLKGITQGTVVITAHGAADEVFKTIRYKELHLIDATCPDVRKTHDLISFHIENGYDVIFYGKKEHPETQGILGISDEIHLIENINEVESLHIHNPNIIFSTQTTMSYYDVLEILQKLKHRFPFLTSFEEVCTATKLRQQGLIQAAKSSDLCIVVGDPKSNNTNKLKEICERFTQTPVIMVENIEGLKAVDFSNFHRIAVTSGASTPTKIVDELIDGIKNNDFTSHLSTADYLKTK